MIFSAPISEIREVNVGRQKIYPRSARAPDVHQMWQRPAARILTRLIARANERGVDKHRQRIFSLAEFGHAISVTRKMPGHENFVRARARTENLLPRAASFEVRRRPCGAKFRHQCVS